MTAERRNGWGHNRLWHVTGEVLVLTPLERGLKGSRPTSRRSLVGVHNGAFDLRNFIRFAPLGGRRGLRLIAVDLSDDA